MTSVDVALWGKVLSEIQNRVSQQRFSLWFKHVELISYSDARAEIGTPNLLVQEWLQNHYETLIRDCFERLTHERPKIEFRVDPRLFHRMRDQQARQRATSPSEIALQPRVTSKNSSPFRKDLRLDNFVVGPCNCLAHAAAIEVAKSKSDIYNPLFLHGDVGLGKTHLLQGICSEFAGHNHSAEVIYVSGEGFTNQFLYALRTSSLDAFRHSYRRANLLVIDDIHFLANTRATQQEFLHTFNELTCADRQIVMASDAHPKHIKSLQQNLVNRFMAGMVANLGKPDYDTRLAILREKTKKLRRNFPSDALEFIAKHVDGNVRELEGAITTTVAYASLNKSPVTLNTAAQVLDHLLGARSANIDLGSIESAVTRHFALANAALRSKSRAKSVSLPRQIAFYLAREFTPHSYSEIGNFFGGRNHSTALSGKKKIETLLKHSPDIRTTLADLAEALRNNPAK